MPWSVNATINAERASTLPRSVRPPLWRSLAARGLLAAGLVVQSAPPALAGALFADDPDTYPTVKFGGRLMLDFDSYDGALNRDAGGDRRTDEQLRRARLEWSGSMTENLAWIATANFLDDPRGAKTEWHDLGVTWTGLPWFAVFVGRGKEPFGLEELTSSKALATVERNYFVEATDADSNTHHGIRLDGRVRQMGWSAAWSSPAQRPQRINGDDRIAFTGRLFGAPLHTGERILHVGTGYTDRNLDTATLLSGFRLDIAESGGEIDSTKIEARQDRQTWLELLYLRGPFSLQSEYFHRALSGAAHGPDGAVDAWYLQATWTLTGEGRAYRQAEGVPDTITPAREHGAIELVVKYDHIAFDADDRSTETARGYLAGVNWYYGRHVKLMLDYTHFTSDNLVAPREDDRAYVLSGRIQVMF